MVKRCSSHASSAVNAARWAALVARSKTAGRYMKPDGRLMLDASSRSAQPSTIPPRHGVGVDLEVCQEILVRLPDAERDGRQRFNGGRGRVRRSRLLEVEADPLAGVRLSLALAIRSRRAVADPVVLHEALGDPLVDVDGDPEGRIRARPFAVAGSGGGERAHDLGI